METFMKLFGTDNEFAMTIFLVICEKKNLIKIELIVNNRYAFRKEFRILFETFLF